MPPVVLQTADTSFVRSMWLSKTQNGSTRLSRWVWIVGITLLIVRIGCTLCYSSILMNEL